MTAGNADLKSQLSEAIIEIDELQTQLAIARAKVGPGKDTEAEGVAALHRLFDIALGDSGQCVRVARFLASIYNGYRFPLDLADLRGLDRSIHNDCLAVLRMDYSCKQEVHRYFEDGGRRWEAMFQQWGLAESQLERAQGLIDNAKEEQARRREKSTNPRHPA